MMCKDNHFPRLLLLVLFQILSQKPGDGGKREKISAKVYTVMLTTTMGLSDTMSSISTLELVSDPWLPVINAGIYLMLLGAASMMFKGMQMCWLGHQLPALRPRLIGAHLQQLKPYLTITHQQKRHLFVNQTAPLYIRAVCFLMYASQCLALMSFLYHGGSYFPLQVFSICFQYYGRLVVRVTKKR